MPSSLSGKDIRIDYKTRTYEELRAQLLARGVELTPEWTDVFPHDPAVVLVELFALQGDILSTYIDRALEEAHWSTAQTRRSIINQAKLIGYNLSPAVSATVDLTLTLDGTGETLYGVNGDNSLSQTPFKVSTTSQRDQASFTFELLDEYVADPAETEVTLAFIEGTTIIESLGSSDGTQGQSFVLGKRGVATNPDGTYPIFVFVNDGGGDVLWTKALSNNFVDSEEDDEHYIMSVDEFDQVTIQFGDGVNGLIPPTDSTITVRYRLGGGSAANSISAGRISSIITQATTVLTATNEAKPSGGDNRETVAEAKVNAPKYFATQNRAASHADYEALALTVNGVRRAKACWYQNRPLIEAVYIAANGENPVPSGTWNLDLQNGTGLLGSVGRTLKSKACASVKLNILPVTTSDVFIKMNVNVIPNFRHADVKARIATEVNDFILPNNTNEIPSMLALSDLYRRIENIRGVDYLTIAKFHRNPYVTAYSIGSANTTFSDVDVFSTVERENVFITFINSTQFEVVGEVSGVHANGTVGTEYTGNNGAFKFTATANTISNRTGDIYKITFGNFVDNVEFLENEIGVLGNLEIVCRGGVS